MPDAGPSQSQDTGTGSRVRGLVQAGLRYAEVRGKLLQIETQEAGDHASKVGVRGVLAVGALLVAWMLSVPALVVLLTEFLKQRWSWLRWEYVALIAAGLHLFIGLIMMSSALRRWRRVRLFEESLNQLKKDREWLAHNQQPPI